MACMWTLGSAADEHSALTPLISHWEIKGRFCKRVVLANVPSFRFSFRGNIRRNHPFGNHPFVNTKKDHWEIKGRFPKGWFWRTYPRSDFRSLGTSAETTLLETTLLRTPESGKEKAHKHKLFGPVAPGTTTGLSQGQTQFVPGTNPGCPWDKPGLSLGQTRVFSLFYTVEAQFVPGTNPVCQWDKPVSEGRQKKFMY